MPGSHFQEKRNHLEGLWSSDLSNRPDPPYQAASSTSRRRQSGPACIDPFGPTSSDFKAPKSTMSKPAAAACGDKVLLVLSERVATDDVRQSVYSM
ncbi:MAG TPA: hypothetical protein DCE43_05520 [Planctomycetaceae bacterium]|nr:hypothetical protein [Planctomycetaceae bacterium]